MPSLFSSTEFWTSLLVALVGGGGVGAIIGAVSSRRKDTARPSLRHPHGFRHQAIARASGLAGEPDQAFGKAAGEIFRPDCLHAQSFPLAPAILRGRRTGIPRTAS